MNSKIMCYECGLNPVFPQTSGEQAIIDLGIFEGFQYFSASSDIKFDKAFKEAEKTPDLLQFLQKDCLPARQIDEATLRKIREKYSLEDELKALRIKDEAYETYVAEVVAIGRKNKEQLGLVEVKS